MEGTQRQQQAKTLRQFRKIHRFTGALLFAFFFVIAVTGLLLGWKKNSGGYLLARSSQGTTTDLARWLPLDSLQRQAVRLLRDSVDARLAADIDRIDVRPDKGMVKFTFAAHYTALQLDGATGRLLQVKQRRADFIEHLHDGSYVDRLLNTPGGLFKLLYTTVMGLALLVFTITGFWLWYGPKRMRRAGE
jgi:uncharacterized iron-regulated membrane protein